jgi:uncharacterized protein with PIN domain
MSYQYKRADTYVVVCDICGSFSWMSNRHWREMPQRVGNQPVHLCPTCRPTAVWCAEHQQYHLPDVLHRRPCADCGGLFTSVVREQFTRCPACRRSLEAPSTVVPEPSRHLTLIQRLFALRNHQHR